MMDIANTLKGLLPKIGFTWNTLLRLFYSLCGWLVVGTLIPITGASGHTPVGTLRRLLDWLDMPSAFTLGMERWCDGHSMLLAAVGFGVMIMSIVLSCMVFEPDDRVSGMEIPPFWLGLLLYFQVGSDRLPRAGSSWHGSPSPSSTRSGLACRSGNRIIGSPICTKVSSWIWHSPGLLPCC